MDEVTLKIDTPLGELYLTCSNRGLSKVSWTNLNNKKLIDSYNPGEMLILDETISQLNEYFSGKRRVFNLQLNLSGTDFQNLVWEELANIPYGQTHSYEDIAKKINQPKASRAVGKANGRNQLCIIIPCHRVIGKSGKLSGYVGGIEIKRKLLELEGNNG